MLSLPVDRQPVEILRESGDAVEARAYPGFGSTEPTIVGLVGGKWVDVEDGVGWREMRG